MLNPFKGSRVQRYKGFGICFVLTLELLNPLNLERASGQTPFYQGKTVRIIVGNLPGDTHDLFARAYSRSMGKHIPGNPAILVRNSSRQRSHRNMDSVDVNVACNNE
jgi:hypothetical protein